MQTKQSNNSTKHQLELGIKLLQFITKFRSFRPGVVLSFALLRFKTELTGWNDLRNTKNPGWPSCKRCNAFGLEELPHGNVVFGQRNKFLSNVCVVNRQFLECTISIFV